MRSPLAALALTACLSGKEATDSGDSGCVPSDEVPYDGIDDDCDGADIVDVDGDLYPGILRSDYEASFPSAPPWPTAVNDSPLDCNDSDALINAGVIEVWYDGVDSDCDGADDFDQDGDGYAHAGYASVYTGSLPATDCDDLNASVPSSGADAPYDGVDADCDCANDFDIDGDSWMVGESESKFVTFVGKYFDVCPAFETSFGATQTDWEDYYAAFTADCDDTDPTISPDASESTGDAVDSDCDGDNDT